MNFNIEYLHVLVFFSVCLFITLILFFLSIIVAKRELTCEKVSSYECGFEPFNDARGTFNVHYYLVGLLFMIFDVELIFIFPWVMSLSLISFSGRLAMIGFLFILAIGFVYEVKSDALT